MTLTSTPTGNGVQTFRLTQSILVLGVVVGGVFLVLIVANIAMGILLWVHERRRSEGQSHGHGGIVSTSEQPSAEKRRVRRPLPETLRMVYRRQTRTESGSFGDDKVTFEVSESVDSSESEEVDDGWHVIQEHSSGIQARPGTQLYQQKWQEVLNPKKDNASEYETNQGNMNNQNKSNSNLSRPSQTKFQGYEDGIIHSVNNSEIGSCSERRYDYAAKARELKGDSRFNEKMGSNLKSPAENDTCIGLSALPSTEVDISDKNTSSKQITEFPVLQNGLIIDIPIKRRSKRTKPSQPGKLYRKKHEIVQTGKTACQHYGRPMPKQLIPSPSHPLSFTPPFTQEIISENKTGENNGQQNNFNSGTGYATVTTVDFTPRKKREETNSEETKTSPDNRTICIKERERKEQGRSNTGGIPKMIKQCSEVSRALCDVIERTNTVEPNRTQTLNSDQMASIAEGIDNTESFVPPVHPDPYVTAPRSPILDWSISDDAKQSYFSQAQALSIDKAQNTLFSITSTSNEMSTQNPRGNSNNQPPGLRHAFIQSARAEQVTHHTISADSNHKKSTGRKNEGNDNYSNMRLVKMPARKPSFVHRLFDRSKKNKTSNILKTFYSEDLTHSHADSKIFPRYSQQYDNAVYELEEIGLQSHIYPYVSTVHVRNKYPLANVTPRFTLSEEDLRMYPDDSIPTIDELVQNGTIKRKKAAKKHIKRNRGNITNASQLKKDENFVLNVPKHQLRTEMQLYTNSTNNTADMTQYFNHSSEELVSSDINRHPWGVDVDLIGFHTGVSNRYHSINDKKALVFGNIGHQNRIGLRGPIFTPNPRMESNQDTTLTADNDQIKTVWPLSKTDDLGDGNWNISITMTAESQSSKEVDSVSSFALSDFDMGESDVDEISNISGDEDGSVKNGYCVAGNGDSREENIRAIEDVRL